MNHPFNRDLQTVLDADEAYEFLPVGTWASGGCGLLAESLHQLIPGSVICVIGRLDQGIPDHLAVRIDYGNQAIYLDHAGVQSAHELLDAARAECRGAPVQICTLSDAVKAGMDMSEVLWQQELVAPFCRHLLRELGEVDSKRCAPVWVDDLDTPDFGPSM